MIINDFSRGSKYFFQGLKRLFHPGVKRFLIIPFTLTVAIIIAAVYFITYIILLIGLEHSVNLAKNLGHLNILLRLLLYVVVSIGFLLLFSNLIILCNIIASPFNLLLAIKAQTLFSSTQILPTQPYKKIFFICIKHQGQLIGYILSRFLLIACLMFIPIINLCSPIVWFIFNAWIINLQYRDLIEILYFNSFFQTRKYVNQRKIVALGFGSTINFLLVIPVFNLIIMPAAVIGAVLMDDQEK